MNSLGLPEFRAPPTVVPRGLRPGEPSGEVWTPTKLRKERSRVLRPDADWLNPHPGEFEQMPDYESFGE